MSCCFSAVGFRLVHLLYVGNCFAVSRALSIVIVQVLSLSLSIRPPCQTSLFSCYCCGYARLVLFYWFVHSLLSLFSLSPRAFSLYSTHHRKKPPLSFGSLLFHIADEDRRSCANEVRTPYAIYTLGSFFSCSCSCSCFFFS
jgi:hypothetical protein